MPDIGMRIGFVGGRCSIHGVQDSCLKARTQRRSECTPKAKVLKFRFSPRAFDCLPQIPRFRGHSTRERGRSTHRPNLFPRLRFGLRRRRNAQRQYANAGARNPRWLLFLSGKPAWIPCTARGLVFLRPRISSLSIVAGEGHRGASNLAIARGSTNLDRADHKGKTHFVWCRSIRDACGGLSHGSTNK